MDNKNFPISFSIDKTFDSDQFLKLRFRLCHDGESPNHTFFTKETMAEANKSLEYIPILAHVYVDEETGKPVIGAHDMHIEEDKLHEGETRLIYDEIPIGVIPSLADNDCAIEEYDGLNYTMVSGFIWRDYANYAEQLIEDAGENKISMEIDFSDDAFSYDVANERYNISAYRYRGVTILNESLGTGMKNAMATTNFSADEDIKSKMIVLMEELQKCLREYNTTNSDKKGVESNMSLDELLEKYELTLDELDFSVDGLSDEELENTLSEFARKKKKKCELDEHFNSLLEQYGVTIDDVDFDYADMTIEELDAKFDEVFAGCKKKKKKCSKDDELFVLSYELSHDDIRSAIYKLLDAYSEDSYCTCWIVEVFDDKFIYQDYVENKFYRCGYSKDGDTVSLMDNKVEVFNEWLSQTEKDALDALKADYVALVEFKQNAENAEQKALKDAVFANEFYDSIRETDEFKALIADADKYTLEEVQTKADLIYTANQKKQFSFSAKNEESKKKNVLSFGVQTETKKKKKAYGGLFDD